MCVCPMETTGHGRSECELLSCPKMARLALGRGSRPRGRRAADPLEALAISWAQGSFSDPLALGRGAWVGWLWLGQGCGVSRGQGQSTEKPRGSRMFSGRADRQPHEGERSVVVSPPRRDFAVWDRTGAPGRRVLSKPGRPALAPGRRGHRQGCADALCGLCPAAPTLTPEKPSGEALLAALCPPHPLKVRVALGHLGHRSDVIAQSGSGECEQGTSSIPRGFALPSCSPLKDNTASAWAWTGSGHGPWPDPRRFARPLPLCALSCVSTLSHAGTWGWLASRPALGLLLPSGSFAFSLSSLPVPGGSSLQELVSNCPRPTNPKANRDSGEWERSAGSTLPSGHTGASFQLPTEGAHLLASGSPVWPGLMDI